MPRIRKIYKGPLLRARERLRHESEKRRKAIGNQGPDIGRLQVQIAKRRREAEETRLLKRMPKNTLVHEPKGTPQKTWREFKQLSEHERKLLKKNGYPSSLPKMIAVQKKAKSAISEANHAEVDLFREIGQRHGIKVEAKRHGITVIVPKEVSKEIVSSALQLTKSALESKRRDVARAVDSVEAMKLGVAMEEDVMLYRGIERLVLEVERGIDHAAKGHLEMLYEFLKKASKGKLKKGKIFLKEK